MSSDFWCLSLSFSSIPVSATKADIDCFWRLALAVKKLEIESQSRTLKLEFHIVLFA